MPGLWQKNPTSMLFIFPFFMCLLFVHRELSENKELTRSQPLLAAAAAVAIFIWQAGPSAAI